jgi:hypothetical protein
MDSKHMNLHIVEKENPANTLDTSVCGASPGWLVRDSNPRIPLYIVIHRPTKACKSKTIKHSDTSPDCIEIHANTSSAAHKSAHSSTHRWTNLYPKRFSQTFKDECGFLEIYSHSSCTRITSPLEASGPSTPLEGAVHA